MTEKNDTTENEGFAEFFGNYLDLLKKHGILMRGDKYVDLPAVRMATEDILGFLTQLENADPEQIDQPVH